MSNLIYNQRDIPRDQWRYGFRASADTGCGWIATHNALHLLGYGEYIPDLIRYYELQLPLIHGNLGTSFWGPALCFRHWGFPVKLVVKPGDYDAEARAADVCILFYYWKKGRRIGAHFVALQHRDSGFVGYNTYRDSTGPDFYGSSLRAFLKEKKYAPSVLICIRDKRRCNR